MTDSDSRGELVGLTGLDPALLSALVDAIVPADDYPSATAAGGLEFLRRVFAAGEQPVERLHALAGRLVQAAAALGVDPAVATTQVLAELGDDEDLAWFAGLVSIGYYGDPDSGGNAGARSWDMVRWRRGPEGWPTDFLHEEDRTGQVGFAEVGERYDVVIIGSGAGGGAAASVFTAAGRRVLVVEAGRWPADAELVGDHLRTPRAGFGFPPTSGPDAENPRVVQIAGSALAVGPADWRWSNNASSLGGGTRFYGAQAWRFTGTDFRMASAYGVPEGSALADWPIGYDDLEPYYSRAEWEMGVAGSTVGDTSAMHRSRDYPMAPLPAPGAIAPLRAGADRLGMSTLAVPLLVNSTPYGGRAACVRCSECVGFACPIGARAGSHNTTLPAAIATGLCEVVVETRAARIVTEASGRATGVELVTDAAAGVARRVVLADEIVVAAGAVESARLLLASANDAEPNGLGNNADQVGRHLQGHAYFGATGVFADEVVDLLGPGPAIASCDFRHGNDGIIGGGMMANEFVPTPSSNYSYLSGLGIIPRWGAESKTGMARLVRRIQRIAGPVQEVTSAESRVRLEPGTRDRLGLPVARLSGSLHPEDLRTLAFMRERAAEWLEASGAELVVRNPLPALGAGPSGGQHQAGTCRMGDDPATSVVDPLGRVWGHDNVRVADGSVHVTNGGVNPVLSIVANALRIADLAVAGR
ncbi:MAG: GMC oxidoreductase [Microbacteriaceae bacterium]|nr:GMC oxidoreductase [Microbacteriaceae bacterium]MCL2796086.1 GMC oxidoreductase [Microbacteriaceae bacterium]